MSGRLYSMERIRELWSLPECILQMYHDAYACELAWHIADVFFYDVSALSDSEFRRLYAMMCHEDASMENGDGEMRAAACRAFVRFVKENGGSESFALPPSVVAEWVPTDMPFNWVDLHQ